MELSLKHAKSYDAFALPPDADVTHKKYITKSQYFDGISKIRPHNKSSIQIENGVEVEMYYSSIQHCVRRITVPVNLLSRRLHFRLSIVFS